MTEDHLFRDASAHGDREVGPELFARDRNLVALRQTHHHAERTAARNDRRLVNGIGRRHVERDQRMATLVIGGETLFLLRHHHRAALGAHHHLVLGVLELMLRHHALGTPGGKRETYFWGKLLLGATGYEFEVAGGSHSSGNLINLAGATGLAVLPEGQTSVAEGGLVRVLRIN